MIRSRPHPTIPGRFAEVVIRFPLTGDSDECEGVRRLLDLKRIRASRTHRDAGLVSRIVVDFGEGITVTAVVDDRGDTLEEGERRVEGSIRAVYAGALEDGAGAEMASPPKDAVE